MVPSLSPPLCSRPAPFAPPPLTATPPPSPPPTTSPSPELAIETLSISRDPPPTPLTRCHEINFQIIWSVDSGPGSANPDEVCPAGWKPGEKSMKPNHNKNIYFALRLTTTRIKARESCGEREEGGLFEALSAYFLRWRHKGSRRKKHDASTTWRSK
ncbi:uncharacterized protein LOC109845614 isoform X2 [Asparagus officinalis]|uniref:uncharacterized protein LOC109845614 isoform X2 n=1 Tax=Asparagus officinalis TaxID=4686 RepID=UPI00098E2C7C|nr:uncharacterized protein LOC109845614 isoform X2 [Asparagus officinalis]